MRACLRLIAATPVFVLLAGDAIATSWVNWVFFASGSYELTHESKRTIAAVFKYRCPTTCTFRDLIIDGHTACAEERVARGLGERRALAVHAYLRELSIPLPAGAIRDRRDQVPMIQLSECVGEPQHRRVEWFVQQ